MTYSVLMAQIVNESQLFGAKPKIAEIKVMMSQTFLVTSSLKSFDRKFEKMFDQMKHCNILGILASSSF